MVDAEFSRGKDNELAYARALSRPISAHAPMYNFAFISPRDITRRDNSDISSVSNNSGLKAITAMMVTNRWVAEN